MGEETPCRLRDTFNILSRKWVPVLICLLFDGKKKFSDLLRNIKGISAKVLSETLNFLEEKGIVKREVVKERRVNVFYDLTDKGRDLEKVFKLLEDWEKRYH